MEPNTQAQGTKAQEARDAIDQIMAEALERAVYVGLEAGVENVAARVRAAVGTAETVVGRKIKVVDEEVISGAFWQERDLTMRGLVDNPTWDARSEANMRASAVEWALDGSMTQTRAQSLMVLKALGISGHEEAVWDMLKLPWDIGDQEALAQVLVAHIPKEERIRLAKEALSRPFLLEAVVQEAERLGGMDKAMTEVVMEARDFTLYTVENLCVAAGRHGLDATAVLGRVEIETLETIFHQMAWGPSDWYNAENRKGVFLRFLKSDAEHLERSLEGHANVEKVLTDLTRAFTREDWAKAFHLGRGKLKKSLLVSFGRWTTGAGCLGPREIMANA